MPVLTIKRLAPVALGAALVLSACGSGSTATESSAEAESAAPAESPAPAESAAPAEDPAAADFSAQAAELDALTYTQLSASLLAAAPAPATLKDGSTFTLKPEIAEKIANGEPINYVISYGSKSIPLFSQQYLIGYDDTLPIANSILPMNGADVSPSTPGQDVSAQIAGIEALLNTGQIDCLSIQPLDDVSMTDITNKAMAQGIPVFTVGVTSNANEFSNFTQVSYEEGKQAAQIVIDWMAETGNDLKVFAVSGGDPSASWAQGRMSGFIDGITAGVPDASFVNGASDAIVTSYDPAGTYDAYKAFLTGNPDVQFIQNVDIGAEHAVRAIQDGKREGEVFTIGWNLSEGQLQGIEAGVQVAALDQAWSQQAGFGALACAAFLRDGLVMPNTQELIPVTAANVAEAREAFNAIVQ
ncbi:MAG: sugar ABC transporter substrate-binding protein [Candidatus Nanopelagicales bacterium]|nr:sugar ABC transporter substrate-binding protein [Candidatus Nanopelagicales bacterium]